MQNEWCVVCPCAPSLPVMLPFCQAHARQRFHCRLPKVSYLNLPSTTQRPCKPCISQRGYEVISIFYQH